MRRHARRRGGVRGDVGVRCTRLGAAFRKAPWRRRSDGEQGLCTTPERARRRSGPRRVAPAASAPHPRSPRLLCRRVEAHARCATYLIRRRDVAKGDRTRGGREDAGARRRGGRRDGARRQRRRRVAASEALDELYAATSEATAFATKVSHPRDVRDATTALAGAYAVVGDSDAIRALKRSARRRSGVAPDQHVFNALLRSEACARREDEDEDEDEEAAASEEEGSSGTPSGLARLVRLGRFRGSSLRHHGVDALPSMTNAHAIERRPAARAVLRVEALMRDMMESGDGAGFALVHGAALRVRQDGG